MKTARERIRSSTFIAFAFAVALLCYLRPVADDFDRYVYEALIRSQSQSPEQIYQIVKHESPRAEASSVLDSPEHLAQLEPMYAIRPFYLQGVGLLYRAGFRPQSAINCVSAVSFFLLAVVLCWSTRSRLYTGLVLITPSVLILGRLGTPDACSSLCTVAAIALLMEEKVFPGVLLLSLSVWARTDNLLVVLAFLCWLVWRKHLKLPYAAALAALSVASVQFINSASGNYGWKVLLHFSFVGGRFPAEIHQGITFAQYAHVFAAGLESLLPQLAPWILLGLAAVRLGSRERTILIASAAACTAHFLLFPSPEARYFGWAYFVSASVFIRTLRTRKQESRAEPLKVQAAQAA